MIRGFYSATSGLIGQQNNMNTIANNLANTSTTGFKPQKSAFSSLLYTKLHGGAGVNVSTGHGSKVISNGMDFTQGTLISSGETTDLAIIGEGFFAVSAGEDGDVYYTRAGNFTYSSEDDTRYLVDTFGAYVLGPDGDKIEVPVDEELDPQSVGVFKFWNQHGLELKGSNRFAATDVSGEPTTIEDPTVRGGMLEGSGTDVSKEMVRMIESSKAFSFNSRVVTTIDEMEKISNQLRG